MTLRWGAQGLIYMDVMYIGNAGAIANVLHGRNVYW